MNAAADVRRYVLLESGPKVQVASVRRGPSFRFQDARVTAYRVKTRFDSPSDWWVFRGNLPMNLYRVVQFPTADEAFSFHLGLMMRLLVGGSKPSDVVAGIGPRK